MLSPAAESPDDWWVPGYISQASHTQQGPGRDSSSHVLSVSQRLSIHQIHHLQPSSLPHSHLAINECAYCNFLCLNSRWHLPCPHVFSSPPLCCFLSTHKATLWPWDFSNILPQWPLRFWLCIPSAPGDLSEAHLSRPSLC